jgi:hypothetical protein
MLCAQKVHNRQVFLLFNLNIRKKFTLEMKMYTVLNCIKLCSRLNAQNSGKNLGKSDRLRFCDL